MVPVYVAVWLAVVGYLIGWITAAHLYARFR